MEKPQHISEVNSAIAFSRLTGGFHKRSPTELTQKITQKTHTKNYHRKVTQKIHTERFAQKLTQKITLKEFTQKIHTRNIHTPKLLSK